MFLHHPLPSFPSLWRPAWKPSDRMPHEAKSRGLIAEFESVTDPRGVCGVRYIRETVEVLAALAPHLADAMKTAAAKAYPILDGTLLLRQGSVVLAIGLTEPVWA